MTADEFYKLKNWFYSYTNTFIEAAKDPTPFLLKQGHTIRVCENMNRLSDSLDLTQKERIIAKATALLHDIGRFPQFKIYGTFSDPLSKNHAALGVKTLKKKGPLNNLSTADQRLIIRAIALHNLPDIPPTLSADLLQLTRMLRDVDKIDIYKVMTDFYKSPQNERSGFVVHNLLDDKKIPLNLVEQIISGRRINYDQVNTLNGIKLFQLSMILDLNFLAAFESVKKQCVVRTFLESMPDGSILEPLALFLTEFIDNKISQKTKD